ncbi:hypothetical protein HDU93_009151, partial [Gonapodya sp. JEL0774]
MKNATAPKRGKKEDKELTIAPNPFAQDFFAGAFTGTPSTETLFGGSSGISNPPYADPMETLAKIKVPDVPAPPSIGTLKGVPPPALFTLPWIPSPTPAESLIFTETPDVCPLRMKSEMASTLQPLPSDLFSSSYRSDPLFGDLLLSNVDAVNSNTGGHAPELTVMPSPPTGFVFPPGDLQLPFTVETYEKGKEAAGTSAPVSAQLFIAAGCTPPTVKSSVTTPPVSLQRLENLSTDITELRSSGSMESQNLFPSGVSLFSEIPKEPVVTPQKTQEFCGSPRSDVPNLANGDVIDVERRGVIDSIVALPEIHVSSDVEPPQLPKEHELMDEKESGPVGIMNTDALIFESELVKASSNASVVALFESHSEDAERVQVINATSAVPESEDQVPANNVSDIDEFAVASQVFSRPPIDPEPPMDSEYVDTEDEEYPTSMDVEDDSSVMEGQGEGMSLRVANSITHQAPHGSEEAPDSSLEDQLDLNDQVTSSHLDREDGVVETGEAAGDTLEGHSKASTQSDQRNLSQTALVEKSAPPHSPSPPNCRASESPSRLRRDSRVEVATLDPARGLESTLAAVKTSLKEVNVPHKTYDAFSKQASNGSTDTLFPDEGQSSGKSGHPVEQADPSRLTVMAQRIFELENSLRSAETKLYQERTAREIAEKAADANKNQYLEMREMLWALDDRYQALLCDFRKAQEELARRR